jgi:4-hydroxy-tetrahydrodipicolinate synthase
MSLGGKGVISVVANILPRETHDMVLSYIEGRVDEAKKLQLDMLEVINALFVEVNPIPVKTAMNLLGFNVGELRMPLCEMTEKNLETLKRALSNYGLLK